MLKFARQTPCAVLLAVQFLGVLLYPSLETSFQGRQLFALFGLLVLALVMFALRATPALTWVAAILALPAVVLLVVQVATGNDALLLWAAGFEAALYFYGAVSMLRYMLDDEVVTTDELFAIGVVFTLLAWAFAHLYVVIQGLDPTAFGSSAADRRSWTDLLFLSFTTLSSTGLSDIVPTSGHARSVNMIEQVAGLFYIAMVVTRLVGLNRHRRA
jgi:hypothetical protein